MMSPLRRRAANLLLSSLVPLLTVGVVPLVLVAAGVIPPLPTRQAAIEEAQTDISEDAPSQLIGEDRPRLTFVVLIVRSFSQWKLGMSDVDDLTFDIAFALSQKPIGAEAGELIASMPDDAIDQLSRVVAEHLLGQG